MNAPARQPLIDPIASRLRQLASTPDPVCDYLSAFAVQWDWPLDHTRWTRRYGRFDPDKRGYCTLLYESLNEPQRLCLVEMSDDFASPARPYQQCRSHPEFGTVCATAFPFDSALTTLPALIERHRHVRVLRYRPYKRCTLRVGEAEDEAALFAKVFADSRGAAIHKAGIELYRAADRGLLDFDVAKPSHWDSANRTLWQERVPGEPVTDNLFSTAGLSLAARMGRACGSIPGSQLRPALRFDASAQMTRTRRYATELMWRMPHLRVDLVEFLSLLERFHRLAGSGTPRPIHGAPHAHQWLDTGERLGLVDFDRCCLGDPELDAATFVAEMDFEDPACVPVAQLNAAFLEAYQTAAGPLDPFRFKAYLAHKHFAKALKAARAVRPDAAIRAERHLARARADLEHRQS